MDHSTEFNSKALSLIRTLESENASLREQVESLGKKLHDQNGLCQEKLSQQLAEILPELKSSKAEIESLRAELDRKNMAIMFIKESKGLVITEAIVNTIDHFCSPPKAN